MIAIEALRLRLIHRPFEPFRVVTSSGESYAVRHPDAAILTPTWLIVAHGRNKDGLYSNVAHISPLHITAVEPLRSRNGAKAKRSRK